jgi:hypothetical protein
MKVKRNQQERTPAVVQNKDWCFQVRVYNGCCTGLHNIKNSKALSIQTFTLYKEIKTGMNNYDQSLAMGN